MDDAPPVVEVTEFDVATEDRDRFVEAIYRVLPILERQCGVHRFDFGPILEPGNGFILLVAWGRLDDHEWFRKGADFKSFVRAFRPLLRRRALCTCLQRVQGWPCAPRSPIQGSRAPVMSIARKPVLSQARLVDDIAG